MTTETSIIPTAFADTFSTNEDTAITGNVLLNDQSNARIFSEKNRLRVAAVNGSTAAVGQTIELASGALLTLLADGRFRYNPFNPNHSRGGFNYLTRTQRARDTFTYTIINGYGGTSTATVTVNIQGMNDAPILEDMTINVDENTSVGTVLGSIIPIHADLNDIVLTSIIGGDTGFSLRNIKDARGFFRYAEVILERGLDFEAQNSFSFTVSGRDYVGVTDTAVITIKVNDVNETPLLNEQSFYIDEHTSNGSLVGQVIATDPDLGQSLTYEIVAGNEAGIFAIDVATGKVSVANSSLLDYETLPTHQLTVKVTDSGVGNLSDTGVVTVNVSDQNEAPVLHDYNFLFSDNPLIGQVEASDVDSNQTLSYTIVHGNEEGLFNLDSITGVISVAGDANFNEFTQEQYILEISVSDNGTPALSDLAQVTIDVNLGVSTPVSTTLEEVLAPESPIITAVLGLAKAS